MNWKNPRSIHLVNSYAMCPVFCSHRFWPLEMANHVAVIGRTWSDVIENITIIVVFIKFPVLRLSLYYLGRYVAKEPWIRTGLSTCQHKNLNCEESAVSRTNGESGFWTCFEWLFIRSQVSGSIVERDWFCNSNIQGKVYCFYCSYLEQVKILL